MGRFDIIDVPDDAPQDEEAMGTKEKFWFDHKKLGRCLYKKARRNTGEDWAEKIAAELCELLGLPHARYELATWQKQNGVVSPVFLPKSGSLMHGNEILHDLNPDYPNGTHSRNHFYRVSQHTLDAVLKIIESEQITLPIHWTAPSDITTAVDTFIGYLLLDAWIGNTDRHHENWAVVMMLTSRKPSVVNKLYLAPTFDHASSLGREVSNEKRRMRLITKDSGFSVQMYVEKNYSALYGKEKDKKPMKTLDAFKHAACRGPKAGKIWLDRLAKISLKEVEKLFTQIPNGRISQCAIDFALKILELNQKRLLELWKKMP